MGLKVTKKAIDIIERILSEFPELNHFAMRIVPQDNQPGATPCSSSFGYGISLDNQIDEKKDKIFSFRDGKVKIIIQKKDLLMIGDLLLDYYSDGEREGLIFKGRSGIIR